MTTDRWRWSAGGPPEPPRLDHFRAKPRRGGPRRLRVPEAVDVQRSRHDQPRRRDQTPQPAAVRPYRRRPFPLRRWVNRHVVWTGDERGAGAGVIQTLAAPGTIREAADFDYLVGVCPLGFLGWLDRSYAERSSDSFAYRP